VPRESAAADTHGIPQDRFKHRLQAARRRRDDLQHLGGRGLPLQRLIALGAVAVESVHLGGEQGHQRARQAKIGGAASGGLLDVKRVGSRPSQPRVR